MKNILNKLTKLRGGKKLCIAFAVAFAALMIADITAGSTRDSSATVHQEVLSGTAQAAEIETVLSGAGTLEADELTAVTVPQQVTVLKYHVRNGETVAKGDVLVSVDKTSASAAMLELNNVLDDLDAELETERQLSNSAYISSTAGGYRSLRRSAELSLSRSVTTARARLMSCSWPIKPGTKAFLRLLSG